MKQLRTPDEFNSSVVIAFRANAQLVAALDEAAAREGLSRADVARRATLQALRKDERHD
jgi:Ribbon-helix-helix protein, copG family